MRSAGGEAVAPPEDSFNQSAIEQAATPSPRTFGSVVGSVLVALIVAAVWISTLVDHDATEKNLQPGFVLLAQDPSPTPNDHVLVFSQKQASTTQVLIWDYAAEDGDQVQVEVNGVPLTTAFQISHSPIAVTVPVDAALVVRGVKDGGGGGVTYAIRFNDIKTSITNGMELGGINTYTLQVKKT